MTIAPSDMAGICTKYNDIPAGMRGWVVDKRCELLFRMTHAEIKVANFFTRKGMKFILQAPVITDEGRIFFADFYLPQINTVLEVDGEYHEDVDRMFADIDRDYQFSRIGVTVVRVLNDGTTPTNLKSLFGRSHNPRKNKRNFAILTRPGI